MFMQVKTAATVVFISLMAALSLNATAARETIYRTDATSGSSDYCYSESRAKELAFMEAKNNACGNGWYHHKIKVKGYVSCSSKNCSNNQKRCTVTKSSHVCKKTVYN